MSIKPTKSHISGIDMVCAVCKENIEPYQYHFYVRPEQGIPVVLHAKDCYDTYMRSRGGSHATPLHLSPVQ